MLAILTVALMLALTGCSGSGSSDTGSAAGGVVTAAPASADAAAGGSAADSTTAAVDDRSIVRTAAVTVGVKDVDASADRIVALATRPGERVDGDQRTTSKDVRTAELTLRVLPARLDQVIAAIDAMGVESSRSVTGQDVTATRADIRARVSALATSVGRLQTFLAGSTTVPNLLALETQLSTRQAELDAMRARQRALADTISLASVSVRVVQQGSPAAAAHTGDGPAGFGSAIGSGWHTLVVSWRWVLATVGYTAPVGAVVVLFVLAGVLVWRRRNRPGLDPASAATTSSSSP